MKNCDLRILILLIFFVGISNAQEQHTHSNAASINNETNSTTGWGGGAVTVSDASDPYHGTYALRLTSTTGATGRYATYSFTAVIGDVYDISIWAKVGIQSNDPAFSTWSGLTGFSTTPISGSSWTEYTFSLTATSTTPSIRVYTGISSGATGDIVYLDRVSIVRKQELHTQSNAASIHNEANSTNGWGGNTINSSVSAESYSGSYSIKFEAPNGGYYRGEYVFPTTPGEQYRITIYAKSDSPSGPSLIYDGFWESNSIAIGTEWTEYTTTRTASGTSGTIWVYTGVPAQAGNSSYIDHISIVPLNGSPDTQAPTAPTLSSTGHADTSAELSWSGATDDTGVTGYKIFKDGALEATLANVSTYQVTGLTAGTSYSFTASALDATGNESPASNIVSLTTSSSGDTQPPTAPTLSSVTQTETTVDLSWSGATDNVGVTGYRIYKDAALEATLGNVISQQVTGLTASTTYSFTVTALDAAGNESPVSNAVSVTTDAGSGGSGSSVWSETSSVASYMGDVAIGTSSVPSGYKLVVEGKIRTREVRVDQDTWPDYVFEEDYDLPSLEEVQKHIIENGHLPNIPSAEEVEANGIQLGEMNRLLIQKIEELTLYVIELERKQMEMEDFKKQLKDIKKKIN